MKKLFLFFLLALFSFLSLPSSTSAQTCDSRCAVCENLDTTYITLDGAVTQCSPTQVSYELTLRTLQQFLGVNIYNRGYTIQHLNQDGDVVTDINIPSGGLMWLCDQFTGCSPGSRRSVGSSSGTGTPANFPNGSVSLTGSVNVEIQDLNFTYCEQGTLNIAGSCSIGSLTPTPSACTPNSNCGGLSSQCLPTQICNSSGVCELSTSCQCDINLATGSCGGGNCPPTHVCVEDAVGDAYCQPDPVNCIPCTDTTYNCGASGQCNILQICIGGLCTERPLECQGNYLSPFCSGLGDPTAIDTALGCIPFDAKPFISTFLTWASGIALTVVFFVLLYAAFLIITAAGDPKRLQAGRELLTAALTGLLLIALSIVILNFLGLSVLGIGYLGFNV